MARVPDAHFERRYAAAADPWDLQQRWYERRKRALTLACLARPRYASAFEPACGAGLVTALLAPRCDALLAVDAAAIAAGMARQRLAGHPHVDVRRGAVPDDWPDATFDLIVLSEVGYYLTPPMLERLLALAVDSLRHGGELMAVHYRPAAAEHVLDGDRVHAAIAATCLRRRVRHVEDLFVLESYVAT